jgi:class 3 adenylate cyclase
MRVLVFSKTKLTSLKSRAKRAGEGLNVEVLPLDSLGRMLPTLGKGSLVYLDIAGLGAREQIRRVAVISEHPELLFGVIDFIGCVADPAGLFRHGAVDYLGKSLAGVGLSVGRIGEVLAYARSVRGQTGDNSGEDFAQAARGWDQIVEGQEYPFFFLFIEVDDAEEMKKRYGHENLTRALDTFRSFIERGVSPYGGKLWMWSSFGGMILFPFGDHSSAPIVSVLRLILWRPFYDVEESPLPNYLSFRMALSTGPMTYREKRTGGIVCDALNSAFHLGQRFTQPGCVTLTADARRLVPDPLKDFCVPIGAFEGRKIYRIRTPLFPSSQRDGE